MSHARRHGWLALALLAAGCAGAPERIDAPLSEALLTVEFYPGFSTAAPKVAAAPVHALVDITALMTPELADGPQDQQVALARTLAGPYLAQRSDLSDPQLHAFHRMGARAEGSCPDPASGRGTATGQAIERLQQQLAENQQAADARVVLFAGFEGQCVPTLCEAAKRLVEPGTWLDVVALGSESVPACLTELRPSAQAPIAWLSNWSRLPAPAYSIEAIGAAGAPGSVIAQGKAGGPAVAITPGLRRLRVELDPPEVIGPIRVRAGDRLRVRVLDFPLSAPNERMWQVDRLDGR
jgi:hypothetical protein